MLNKLLGQLSKKTQKRTLAIDIGTHNTRFLLFKPGKASIDKMILKATPAGSFNMGNIIDESLLADFLIQSFSELELEDEVLVITGVSGKSIIAKKIDIPQMEEKMIPEYVEIEAEQELFYNKEEMELDYELLQGVNFQKPEAPSLLVITVLKKVIESYNNLIGQIAECDILDTHFSALFNSVEHNENLNQKAVYMLLDIGASATNLLILIKNQIVFARNLPLGGNFFNQGIEKKMSMSYEEAEELKIAASQGQEAPKELVSLITNELNPTYADEVFSCYELYCSLFPKTPVNQAFITGGASQTLNLTSTLQNKIGCSFKPFDPFQNIELPSHLRDQKEELKKYTTVVTGLALRSLHDKN